MSEWWDERAQRYRTSLPHKIFYVWTWPLSRWLMFHTISSERAHWMAIHVAIPAVVRVNRIWGWVVFCLVFPLFLIIAPFCKEKHDDC